jgi:hypothetical protein
MIALLLALAAAYSCDPFVDFSEWLLRNGAEIGPLEIADIPGFGRGVRATQDIEVARWALCAV